MLIDEKAYRRLNRSFCEELNNNSDNMKESLKQPYTCFKKPAIKNLALNDLSKNQICIKQPQVKPIHFKGKVGFNNDKPTYLS